MAMKKVGAASTSPCPQGDRSIALPAAPRRRISRSDIAGKQRPRTVAVPDEDAERILMQVDCAPLASVPLLDRLRERIVGQTEVVDALVGAWARLLAGLRDPERPLLTGLLLGPTGVGKTETARAVAEALFGTPNALVRINCEEYAQGHEVAKLLGSPPGYVGADIEPLLSQNRIDRPHWELRQRQRAARSAGSGGDASAADSEVVEIDALIDQVHDPEHGLHSILLFDEIEKAHPALWNALLGVLEDGQITLGNNKTTDLRRSIILMTSNAGSREMSAALRRRPLGFTADEAPPVEATSLRQIAREAARQLFPAEFLNRFDEVLAFMPLGDPDLNLIFDRLMGDIAERALARAELPLLVRVSEAAKARVIAEGTDPSLGARPLRRAMERLIVDPLSRLIASEQVIGGDVLEVDLEDDELAFYRLPRESNAIVA